MAFAILCVGIVFIIFAIVGGIALTHYGKRLVEDGQEAVGHIMSAVGWVLIILFSLSVLGILYIFFAPALEYFAL